MMSEEKRIAKPLTNGDRLRAMSNEELAESIAHIYFSELAGFRWLGIMKNGNLECFFKKQNAIKSTLDWLNSQAESARLQDCEIAKSQDREESEG
ncbi:MAG: hypothetical protein ACI4UV_13410 [Victivallales bacterium]